MEKNTYIKSICFFCNYYTTPNMPLYVRYYLTELTRHFSEIWFLTNGKTILPDDLEFLQSHNISYRLYKNEGFDFGMWYKAFRECDVEQYDRVGLVNDSCILFRKLDFFFEWVEGEKLDYAGMTDCNGIEYHVQSYFLVINKNAIAPVKEYLERNGIIGNIKEVIKIYEVGLSQYLIGLDLKLKAYYPIQSLPFPLKEKQDKHGRYRGMLITNYHSWGLFQAFRGKKYMGNPMLFATKELIKQGIPLIKKKILTRLHEEASLPYMIRFGFDPDPGHYLKLINKMYPEVKIKELTADILVNLGWRKEIKFYSYIYLVELYFYITHKIYLVKRSIILMIGRD